MHYKKRTNPGFVLNLGEIDSSDGVQIEEIIDEKEGEYMCVVADIEDVEWRKLPPSHLLIAFWVQFSWVYGEHIGGRLVSNLHCLVHVLYFYFIHNKVKYMNFIE